MILSDNVSLDKYWQEGLDYISVGQKEEAQATWLIPFLDPEILVNGEQLIQDIVDYLSTAIDKKIVEGDIQNSYEICKCLLEIDSSNIDTYLRLLNTSILVNEFSPEILTDQLFIETLSQSLPTDFTKNLLYSFITQATSLITEQYIDAYIDFLKLVASKVANKNEFVCIVAPNSFSKNKRRSMQSLQTRMLEVCLENAPIDLHFTVLCDLLKSHLTARDFYKAIAIGEQCKKDGEKHGKIQQVCGSYQLFSALMEAGEWQRIPSIAQQHIQIIQDFIENPPEFVPDTATIITTSYFLNYLYDDPRLLHNFRNKIGNICVKSINGSMVSPVLNECYISPEKTKLLRIGYIASTLEEHSVGWLSRWIFHYHDRSKFEIFIYHVGQENNNSFNHKFFRNKADVSHYLKSTPAEIADLIRRDKIDILIDLDSLSLSSTYQVMCHKPAPVSATWLGWDTSGCPNIDYFIADPYVLPPDAEEYYHTKIWRLPQTYIAVDGFEVETPTKRRSDYQIPEDSIIYLCAQKSYKHHPDILRLQMQIIKQVDNSYLMVQLRANPDSLIKTYQELANEVGISMERLRFIHTEPDELTHRANLQLADVVLDTFPYNGATTTLETLWMGVPLVTKVGQAFVARNSFAFMKNLGITEGIAHTDAEYVDWGVRLGNDLALRQQVMGKMLNSRKKSPLWDARSFTKEMEQAYQQMWEIYQSQQGR